MGHEVNDVTSPSDDYDILNTLICQHIPVLPNLKSITVMGVTWNCLTPQSKAVLGSLQQLKSICWQSVVFEYLEYLLDICSSGFPYLHALKIRQIILTEPKSLKLDDTLPAAVSNGSRFPNLHLLDIVVDKNAATLLSISSPTYIQPRNIDTMCFSGVSVGDAILISLRAQQKTVTREVAISLSQNSNLRSVEISTFNLHPSMHGDTSWLQAMIATITSQELREITIWINTESKEWIKDFDFRSLEKALLPRLGSDSLALVEFTLHIKFGHQYAWSSDYLLEAVAAVETQLPAFHTKGCLVVHTQRAAASEALDGWWPYVWGY
ncbi:hypothetical protein BT96DRAFT_999463 [Gymnopus androsaceus JB14]|uniref:F-box domain-containing protein n=1 Tax=Gymnopus androsaceus JB14 TaxID=1447944 RepID=A0A6A4H8A6_9AGAR|nr:hypothetical protein BT96DRAFT_999463 [Gymnopus androsaceus JB14]